MNTKFPLSRALLLRNSLLALGFVTGVAAVNVSFGQQDSFAIDATESPVVQQEAPLGLDEQIDAWFRPIADWSCNIVFVSTPAIGPLPGIPFVLILLVAGAIYFTLYFRFANFRLFGLAINVVRGQYEDVEQAGADEIQHAEVFEVDGDIIGTARDESQHGEVSHFQALSAAVSGTVGLGNIGGVAAGIAMGGPGATFWMIVCGLLGMSSKFVECTLGVKYRDIEPDGTVHGGPAYYLSKGLKGIGLGPLGNILAIGFAALCVGGSLAGGNMFQANQTTAQIQSTFGIDTQTGLGQSSGVLLGVVMAVFVGIVIVGGIKRIANVAEKIVPLMAILYVAAGLFIIAVHVQHIPAAFESIFRGAFSLEAGIGGLVGVMIQGFQRAAFSNEAGAGSAAIAHSAVRTRYPASEGIVSLIEPFLDTVVICTMTALVIILFNADGKFDYAEAVNKQVLIKETGERVGGVDLTSLAFDSALPNFRFVLTISVCLFAFATMISWFYYGLTSWKYLFGRGRVADLSFKLLYCACIVIGSAASLTAVLNFADAMVLGLVFPNMVGLLLLAPKVRDELNRYLQAIGKAK